MLIQQSMAKPGNPYWREGLSTDDLLVLSSLDQLLLILSTLFTFCKTVYLNEEVKGTEPSPSASVPWPSLQKHTVSLPTIRLDWNNYPVEKHASLIVWSVSDKEKKVLKLRSQKRKNLMKGKKDPPKVLFTIHCVANAMLALFETSKL